mgnify:CR=1 FL=1
MVGQTGWWLEGAPKKWPRRLAVDYWIAMLASSACHNQMENQSDPKQC